MYTTKNNNRVVDGWVNGGTASDSGTVTISYDPPNVDNYIGKQIFGSNQYTESYKGIISEIIIFDTPLTDDQIIKVQYYLSKKWGLETSIDSDGDGIVDATDELPMSKG